MYKKLVSLVLVLAIASMASAIQWAGGQAVGNWNVAAKWDAAPARVPAATDALVKLQPNDGVQTSHIIVTDAQSGGVKTQITSFAAKLVTLQIVGPNGSLTNSGSFDGYTGSLDCTIGIGGVWNSCTVKQTGTNILDFKMAANTAVVANSVVVTVYGTLNVKATGTGDVFARLAMVNDTRSGTSGVNIATVNIKAGGLVDVDSYTIGKAGVQYGTGRINIWKNGVMKIKGSVTAQVKGDIDAGRIVGMNRAAGYYESGGYTYVVPEPATMALLGLGSLMLCRKKR